MIELFIALSAGLVSFLSPCVLPLIPGYISFISGQSLNELVESKKVNLIPLVLFSLGFSFVFISFGAAASALGKILLQNSNYLRIVAGTIIVIFSLQLLGIINIGFLNFEKKYYTNKSTKPLFVFIMGMAFGFGWTPCIGPILGSILALASIEESILKGIVMLSFYSLGLAIPFIISGFLIQKFLLFSKNFKKNINKVSKVGGIVLLITGILILTNQLQAVGFYILDTIPYMQNFG
jgi:cytochrome c-type biogenesis protein